MELKEKTVATDKEQVPVLLGKNGPEETQDASSAEIKIPVDNANKLLYDLDATVNKMFDDTAVAKEEKSDDGGVEDPQVYSAANRELDFYPRQSQANQQAALVTQLENLEKRLLVSEHPQNRSTFL